MKRVSFYNTNRSDDLLHIETEGCIVNIRVNLHNLESQEVTSIEIIPDSDSEKFAKHSDDWPVWDLDGTINNRVVRRRENQK